MANPTLEEFMEASGPASRAAGATDSELRQYWAKTYSQIHPSTLPTWEVFKPTILKQQPDLSEDEVRAYWDEHYGDLGAREKDQGDFLRGGTTAFQQIPQLASGLEAGAGAIGEKVFGGGGLFTALKEHGLRNYREIEQEIAAESKPSDSVTEAYQMARAGDPGALVDWLQHTLGYGGAQALQMLATAGVGYAAGKMALRPAVEAVAGKLITRESTRIAATEAGAKLAAGELAKQAVSNVAGKAGQLGALGATAVGMEGGEIFGGLVDQAAQEGRALTGGELAKAAGMMVAAGGLEFYGDKFGLDLIFGKSVARKLASSRLGHTAASSVLGTVVEGGVEFTQTLLEEFGKGNDPLSPESIRQAVDAAAVGGVTGGAMGGLGGAVTRPGRPQADLTVTERTPQELGLPGEASPLPDVSPVTNAPTLDGAIAKSLDIVQAPTVAAKALAEELVRMQADARQAEDTIAAAPTRRPSYDTPTVQRPAQIEPSILDQPSPIVPGRAFPPRAEPEVDFRQALADERARMVAQREEQRASVDRALAHAQEPTQRDGPQLAEVLRRPQQETPVPPPARVMERPLKTAQEVGTERGYPSVQDLHALAESRGLQWDNNPLFMELTKMATGKAHLDALSPVEREKFSQTLAKIKAPQQPAQTQEAPPQVPLTPLAQSSQAEGPPASIPVTPIKEQPSAPVTAILEAQVPRNELTPQKNVEMLLRAQKAQADMEIAGTERGGRFHVEQSGAGGTHEVVGLKSPTADWYKELTTGTSPLIRADRKQSAREKIETAIQKIIADEGADRGKAVELVKATLLGDREFSRTEWGRDLGSILQGTWPSWVEKPKGTEAQSVTATPIDTKAHEAATSPRRTAKDSIDRLVDQYLASGRTAFRYPRRRTISVDGRGMPEAEAVSRMRAVLQRQETAQQQKQAEPSTPRTTPAALKAEAEQLKAPKTALDLIDRLYRTILDDTKAVHRMQREQKDAWRTVKRIDALMKEGQQSGLDYEDAAARIPVEDLDALADIFGIHRPAAASTRSFSVERLDPKTGEPQTDTFAIGDYVDVWISGNKKVAGEITGISNARQEARVGNRWYEFGRIYPAASPKPVPKPRPTEKLSRSVQKAEHAPPGGWNAGDRVSTEEPFSLTAPTVTQAKPQAEDRQTSIEIPPEVIGSRPIIGREVQPDDAPLFSKAAQEKDAEQTTLEVAAPADQEKPSSSPADILASALRNAADEIQGKKIEDVGEKVGGARKDLVGKSEPKAVKPKPEGPAWQRRYTVSQVMRSSRPAEEGKWQILDTKDTDFAGRSRKIGPLFETEEEARSMIPVVVVSKTHHVYKNRAGKWEIFKLSGDKKLINVVNQQFDTEEDAKRYLAQNAAEILETKTFFGEEILPRPETVKRIGEDRRNGRNVEANDFKDTFGFRAIEFGNWQNQDDRQDVMNHAYDGLHDLAETLGIPPRAIGLNRELALAFGSRGAGLSGVVAHYERNYGVINLTKMHGAGYLAHEWFHAADHYFGRQDTKASSEKVKNLRGDLVYKAKSPLDDYASHGFSRTGSQVREALRVAHKTLIDTMLRKGEQFVADAQKADAFVAEARARVAEQLTAIRDSQYGGLSVKKLHGTRNASPATAEQLAEFDVIANHILEGELFPDRVVSLKPTREGRYIGSVRTTNDALDKISAIYKTVRGRSGFGTGDQRGLLDDLRSSMKFYSVRLKMLADAQSGTAQTKDVPTSFAMEAKSMDQGRKTPYWATRHEMAARAFSAYVEDKLKADGKRSDFITYHTEGAVPTIWGFRKPYPEGTERQAINQAFDKFVETLQTKETDQGTALYEPETPYGASDDLADVKAAGSTTVNAPNILMETDSVLTEGQSLFEKGDKYETRPGEQQALNYDLARQALGDLDRATGVSTAGRAVYGDRVPAKTVALAISPDLIHQGVVDLTGYQVAGPEDLAKLAQVYRDPRFETFRLIYVKGEKIVGHEGVTSRLPGFVKVFQDKADADAKMASYEKHMDELGADGYYLLHNHPSGNSHPSQQDLAMTERFAERIPGFKGHVVIDSNEYNAIELDKYTGIRSARHVLNLGQDTLLAPSVPHPLLGAQLDSPHAVAHVGLAIKPATGYATVVYKSGGRTGATRAIQEVSVRFLSDSDRAATYLKKQSVAFGAYQVFVHTHALAKADGHVLQRSMDGLIREGYVHDYVVSSDAGPYVQSRRESGIQEEPDVVMGEQFRDLPSYTVKEQSDLPYEPYDARLMEAGDRPTGTINPPQARSRLKASKVSLRPYLLGALGLEQIAQVYGQEHAEVAAYNKAVQAMESDFVEMSYQSDKIARAWTKLKIPVADKMAQVMEDARFLNFDPDPAKKQDADTDKKRTLRERFVSLPDAAKDTYRLAREYYSAMSKQRFDALSERITREGGTQADLDELQEAYTQERRNIYFPFARFGEHLVVARKMEHGKEVDRDMQAFESVAESQKFADLMRLKGWVVKQTVAREYSRERDGSASKVVDRMKQIIERLDQSPTLPGVARMQDMLLDSLTQSYLQSMPDLSYAKHFIHARDVKGASKDALRAFAHSALHGAHHISRIRHADRITNALTALDDRINRMGEGDTIEVRQVYNELIQRHTEIMNPNTHPVAAWLGQLGFTMSLGGVVATGVANMTQVPLIAYPWLGARFGFGKASAALAKAYKDFLDPRTLNSDSLFDARKGLTEKIERLMKNGETAAAEHAAEEVKMLKELARRGRITLTQMMDLAGLSAQDNLGRVARQIGTTHGKVMRMLGFTFHAPEVMNRQVTALAAFRLERESGSTFEQSLERANQAVIDTQFLYTAENRPRYMSGNVLRILTMFKQYPQQIAFLYGRAASIWLDKNHATAEERTVAKRQLISMLALQFGAAGALGMPFFGASADLLMAVVAAFGDDDEKRDWDVALRRWLDGSATSLAEAFMDDKEKARAVGKEAGEVVSHGLSRLTPFDMANRLGQQDLFVRTPQREREGRAAAMDWLTSLSGPVSGYLVNGYLGIGDIKKGIQEGSAGFFLRGVEELTPAVIRNGVKSLRYALEDVRTRDQYKQLDLRRDETLGQAFGFGPSRIAEMYESVTAIRDKEHRAMDQKKTLLERFARAVQERDTNRRQKILGDIRAFNSRNPMFGITSETLNRSLKARRQHEAGMERGIYLPGKRRALLEEAEFGNY